MPSEEMGSYRQKASHLTEEYYHGIHIGSIQSLQRCYPTMYGEGARICWTLLAGLAAYVPSPLIVSLN
jgi:hypothetical protein